MFHARTSWRHAICVKRRLKTKASVLAATMITIPASKNTCLLLWAAGVRCVFAGGGTIGDGGFLREAGDELERCIFRPGLSSMERLS